MRLAGKRLWVLNLLRDLVQGRGKALRHLSGQDGKFAARCAGWVAGYGEDVSFASQFGEALEVLLGYSILFKNTEVAETLDGVRPIGNVDEDELRARRAAGSYPSCTRQRKLAQKNHKTLEQKLESRGQHPFGSIL